MRAIVEVIGLVVVAALVAKFVANGLGFSSFGIVHGLAVGGVVTLGYMIAAYRSRTP